jgi:hypothetical protein
VDLEAVDQILCVLSCTGEKMVVLWYSTSTIYRLKESLCLR